MFVSRLRAAADGDRSPWGDFFFEPVGLRSGTGARVNADSALRLAAVYASTRVLTEGFAVLPFRLYRRRQGKQQRQLVTDHWLVRLFTRRPNRWQSPFEFKELLQGHLVLRGNAICAIHEDGVGGIAELVPLHPDRVRVETLPNSSWRYVHTSAGGDVTYYRRDQVWHLRGLSSDGIMGMNPIALAREAVATGLSAQEYGNRFFANDAKPTGGWVGTPDNVSFADKATRQTYRESIQEAISGSNRHKLLVLDRGMKYNEVGATNKDAQFLEARNYNRSEIAGLFRVPPHMIGDLSRATFSNIEQQSIDFWQNTMLPWTERWESNIESQLLGDEDLEVEFDFRNLMRGDSVSRGGYLHNMVLDGILTRNEARDIEGFDALDGLDEPLVPVNERELSSGEEATAPASAPSGAPPPPMDGDDSQAGARLSRLLQSNAQRMARRIAAGDPPSAEVLVDAMAITLSQAQHLLAELGREQRPAAAVAADLLRAATTPKGQA